MEKILADTTLASAGLLLWLKQSCLGIIIIIRDALIYVDCSNSFLTLNNLSDWGLIVSVL